MSTIVVAVITDSVGGGTSEFEYRCCRDEQRERIDRAKATESTLGNEIDPRWTEEEDDQTTLLFVFIYMTLLQLNLQPRHRQGE